MEKKSTEELENILGNTSPDSTVDGKKVNMVEDNGSVNAEAPLTVVNTRGFDLPKTGDHGTWMYSIGGVLLMVVAASAMFFALRKKGSVN